MSVSQDVYSRFLTLVIVKHVLSDDERSRADGPMSEAIGAEVAQGKRMDARRPYLATVSGKGGWDTDPAKAARYAGWANVSLLDHLASVTRGALQLAEVDLTAAGVDTDAMSRRLHVIAATAFLHDADKMLGVARETEVTVEQMEGLMQRYGVHAFLAEGGASVSAAQMTVLVDEAEVGRSGKVRPGLARPNRESINDIGYVRVADRADGMSLLVQGQQGLSPVQLALREITGFGGYHTVALTKPWTALEIREPHLPLLCDAFLDGVSEACLLATDMPPLLQRNHDGLALAVVPLHVRDAVIEGGIAEILHRIGGAVRLETNARGALHIMDARGSHADLGTAIGDMTGKDRANLFRLHVDAMKSHGAAIDELLGPYGLAPSYPDLSSYGGKLAPFWTDEEALSETAAVAALDAIAITASLRSDKGQAGKPRNGRARPFQPEEREKQLAALLEAALPGAWEALADMEDGISRYNVLAAYAAGAAAGEPELARKVHALCDQWLAGDAAVDGATGREGINDHITVASNRFEEAIRRHLTSILDGKAVTADEEAPGRCHFTNAPVPRSAVVDGASGLYGLNVSAFSGRMGRPASFRSSQSETLVSTVAEAEGRLLTKACLEAGKSPAKRGTPVRVSSPTSAGLFPALVYERGQRARDYAMSDALRVKLVDGKLRLGDQTGLSQRNRIAVHEEYPTRTASSRTEPGQVAFTRQIIEVAMRTGRPVHVFRGLPVPRPEFVHFDCLPPAIEAMLGGKGLRLEQLPGASLMLRGVDAIGQAFGLELALRFGDPGTRYGAACEVWSMCRDKEEGTPSPEVSTAGMVIRTALGRKDMEGLKTRTDSSVVDFGRAMAMVQRRSNPSDGKGFGEVGMKLAFNAVGELSRMGETSRDSLVTGVVGAIRELFERRNFYARKEVRDGLSPETAAERAATLFVDGIWNGALEGVAPASRTRKVLLATYRHAFETESRGRYAKFRSLAPGDTRNGTDDIVDAEDDEAEAADEA